MYRYFKRWLDLASAFMAIILLAPVLILLMILIRIKLGGPVFFTQNRPGLGAKVFKMVKFRSMTNERDEKGELLPDQMRITTLGRFLRRTSLDELPELINVLQGDMSVIGPRPLLVKYLPFYTKREMKRHEVRPGITGWAQVNGRNLLNWDKRLELDAEYVETMSLGLDIRILLRTIRDVLRQSDVLEVSSETVPDFDDYRKQTQSRTHEN
ncbi:MAG: sugar transferase [Bacteroidetes bacterium]|nr:MAG: sugar transferase [Bacteroidota bacterium]